MKIHRATPGVRIRERRRDATVKTVVSWENDGFGKTLVRVRGESGRTTHIAAKNIGRYDIVADAKDGE